MEVRLDIPKGVQIIEKYGNRRFKVAGTYHEGSVLIFPEKTQSWPVTDVNSLDESAFAPFIEKAAQIDILLLGCGPSMRPVPPALRWALREKGLVIDLMDTGAACRTYNVLVSEGRKVAAALIAVA